MLVLNLRFWSTLICTCGRDFSLVCNQHQMQFKQNYLLTEVCARKMMQKYLYCLNKVEHTGVCTWIRTSTVAVCCLKNTASATITPSARYAPTTRATLSPSAIAGLNKRIRVSQARSETLAPPSLPLCLAPLLPCSHSLRLH